MSHERLVAYFDILGFKNLVLSESLESMVGKFGQIYTTIGAAAVRHEAVQQNVLSVMAIAERYDKIEASALSGIRRAFEEATQMTLLILSDSVIVYSAPLRRTDEDFQRHLSTMLRVSRTVLDKLLEYGLPVRGAISYGEFYVDAANGIYVGRALVEAYGAAETQEWIGVVVAPTLGDDIAAMEQAFSMALWRENRWLVRPDWDYVMLDVPFKKGSKRMYVVNWATSPNASKFATSELFTVGTRSTPHVALKYTNTLRFLDEAARKGFRGLTPRRS